MENSCVFKSPVGLLKICEKDGKLTGLSVVDETESIAEIQDTAQHSDNIAEAQDAAQHSEILCEACRQLGEYFAGRRREFDLPTDCEGTAFQRQVWQELQKIPYGETRYYQEIAMEIGNPRAVRAVGQANGRNPIMIIIPCHRVIQKNGDIAGFAYGIEVKRYLLDLEKGINNGL